MRKLMLLLTVALILSVAFSLCVTADEGDAYYYVSLENGYDRNSGRNADEPVKNIFRAMNLAVQNKDAKRAVIVIMDNCNVAANLDEVKHPDIPFVITSHDGVTDYRKTNGAKVVYGNTKRYYLGGDTTFENITFEYEVSINFVAQYNPITFGEGIEFVPRGDSYIGIYIVGGWQTPGNGVKTALDSHITVNSGEFAVVVGGSRQKESGAKEASYTGTHYINVGGGHIRELYGSTISYHTADSLVFNMTGGKIDTFHTGSDAETSRRLKGSADVTLGGGEITEVICDDVIGGVTVKLVGSKIGRMSAGYASSDLEKQHNNTGTKNILRYDLLAYTSEQISAFTGFEAVEGMTDVYVKAGANGGGTAENDPTSLEKAIGLLSEIGGTVKVIGRVSLSTFKEPSHPAKIKIVGTSRESEIAVSGEYVLLGDTVFESIGISGKFNAEKGLFTAGSGVICKDATIVGNASLRSGSYKAVEKAKEVVIKGASVEKISCGKNATVVVRSGKIGTLENPAGAKSFEFSMIRGNVERLVLRSADKLVYRYRGGTVSNLSVEGSGIIGSYIGDVSTLGDNASRFNAEGEKAFFLSGEGDGSGTSPLDASSSIEEAYKILGNIGGTVVICGPYTHSYSKTLTNVKPIVVTSVYGGVDYAKTSGAKMIFTSNYFCGGETEFCDVTLEAGGKFLGIIGNGNKLHIGENITSIADRHSRLHLCLVAGTSSSATGLDTDMTVDSGIWDRVRGGNSNSGQNCNVKLTINGGEFYEISLVSKNAHTGDVDAVINGGLFTKGVSVSVYETDPSSFSGDVTLTVNGGVFYGEMSVSKHNKGSAYGSYTLNINGGDLRHINEIYGSELLGGNMVSTLNAASNINIDAEIDGEMSFTNAIRQNGADPWIFYHDGYYYYTASEGRTLSLARARNIGDLKYAESRVIYSPESGHPWSAHQWSPEIHYYTDEQIGEGNGGWYCYISPCSEGVGESEQDHRMYVIKCLDGDNLMGRWGNPVTGEVNVPERVVAKNLSDWDTTWAGGQSGIIIDGKAYTLYVGMSKERDASGSKHQYICIVPMTNPWTIVGIPTVICIPEYDWEKVGSESGGTQVVEGATAVYGSDGSVYIIYSGSGYWTTEYQLGQLKYLGGDPCNAKNWEKKPTSIFRQNGILTGSGHASYVTDTFGQAWICYHAYVGDPDTFENRSHPEYGGGRLAFVEPYYADKNGVVIADGAMQPAPMDRVYTVKLNSMPIGERIFGFTNRKTTEGVKSTEIKMTLGSLTAYVNGSAKALDASPVIKNSRTMLPVRFVAENLGATVGWDAETQTVSVKGEGVTIEIVIGSSTAKVGGKVITLDSPAYIEPSNNRTYLPVRVVAESLGASVSWEDATKTATLKK